MISLGSIGVYTGGYSGTFCLKIRAEKANIRAQRREREREREREEEIEIDR